MKRARERAIQKAPQEISHPKKVLDSSSRYKADTWIRKEVDTMKNSKRKIEIFSAGCSVCQQTIDLVNRIACSSCEVIVLDMNDMSVVSRANDLGIRSVPAVVIDGRLADCCAIRGPEEGVLRALGLGQSLT